MLPARRYSRDKSCLGKRGGQKSKVIQVEFFPSHFLHTFCGIVLTVCTMNEENKLPCLASCLVARCLTNSVWKVLPQNVCQKGAPWLFKAREHPCYIKTFIL